MGKRKPPDGIHQAVCLDPMNSIMSYYAAFIEEINRKFPTITANPYPIAKETKEIKVSSSGFRNAQVLRKTKIVVSRRFNSSLSKTVFLKLADPFSKHG